MTGSQFSPKSRTPMKSDTKNLDTEIEITTTLARMGTVWKNIKARY
jgi:hypothetical protein